MTTYLTPDLPSKRAYKEALASGKRIQAKELTPWGEQPVREGTVCFSGPHYPKPHRFYGQAQVKDFHVISIK